MRKAIATRPILILRHSREARHFYDVVLAWVQANAPECLEHIAICDLPLDVLELHGVRLVVPWLQDPVQAWSPRVYRAMDALARRCEESGAAMINPVARLTHAGKAEAARRIAATGLRTPRMSLVTEPDAFREDFGGLPFPLFVREDWGHGGPMLRADDAAQARALPLETLRRPVAVELVDVRDPRDGLYAKYRYFAAGDRGVAHHLQVSRDWITRGGGRVFDDAARERELAYIAAQDPHHERLQAARRALELDIVALDYGHDREGRVVVWEANPFPHVQFGRNTSRYRNHAIHRTIAAMLAEYLVRAGLPVPPPVQRMLAYRGAY
ncbi:MAG: hypothetical protein EOP93_17415 [Lysobacteraceae bacterium]|nr:MAG: hypothetical protein EOP93_17415 [Xanthomonadaceae bacterium]